MLVAGGWSSLILALFYYVIDVRRIRGCAAGIGGAALQTETVAFAGDAEMQAGARPVDFEQLFEQAGGVFPNRRQHGTDETISAMPRAGRLGEDRDER